jgi:uncharacterized protein YutE (UPF0331/DUF86 family)
MDVFEHQLQMAERLAAITQQIGFTLWQLQELEGVTAQYFVLLAQAHKGIGLTAGNALVEKAQAKTFGTTIREIAKAGLLAPELEVRFSNLLAERNWLVHKSRASSRSAVHNDDAMHKLLLRVDAMAEESNALLSEVGKLSERFVKQHGVSDQQVENNANQLLEQWHTADAT